MRFLKSVCLLSFLVVLAACSKPLPPAKAHYAGHWTGKRMQMLITAEGSMSYSRAGDGNVVTSIDAPIQAFTGNDMVVGVGPLTTTFVVSAPPRQDGAAWKMTVDGVELTRK